MRCLVTAGPAFEPLDQVRRLTNFSTGRLGSGLANYLAGCGHQVRLFLSESVACPPLVDSAAQVIRFTTGADLAERLAGCPVEEVDAVFHAAAVSDFRFGEVREREPDGGWRVVSSRKYSTRHGSLWVELLPTPKILSRLRDWFPRAILVGWKFEVEGDWVQAIERGAQQIRDSRTDVCVVNGSAYGQGYYCMQRSGPGLHCADPVALFVQLARMCDTRT